MNIPCWLARLVNRELIAYYIYVRIVLNDGRDFVAFYALAGLIASYSRVIFLTLSLVWISYLGA